MKTKQLLSSALIAVAVTTLFASAAKASASKNDLYLGIFDASSSNDYVVDLGAASNFASGTPVSLNLNADLGSSSLFGSNYQSDASLVFSLVGYSGSSINTTGLFLSEDSVSAVINPPVGFSKASSGGTAAGVNSVIAGFNNAAAAGTTPSPASGVYSSNVSNAVIQPAGETSPGNSYQVEYNVQNEFQTGDDLVTAVNGGTLDLYKLPIAVGGAATLLGTAQISNAGVFTFTATSAPEPSTYALMALGLGALAFRMRRLAA